MKLMDSTQTTNLFTFNTSSGSGQLRLPTARNSFGIGLQKNGTSGSKGMITHKRGIKNRSTVISVLFAGANRATNRDTFKALVTAQTTVFLDAESDADLADLEGLYDFDGSFSQFIKKRNNMIEVTVGLFENLNGS